MKKKLIAALVTALLIGGFLILPSSYEITEQTVTASSYDPGNTGGGGS
jgi:phosphomevalonate kinase